MSCMYHKLILAERIKDQSSEPLLKCKKAIAKFNVHALKSTIPTIDRLGNGSMWLSFSSYSLGISKGAWTAWKAAQVKKPPF